MNFSVHKIQTENGINYLNIFLMLLSCFFAFFIPFHLFLFVYAVMGPLHYLTEISWLEKRNFFVPVKRDVLVYSIVCVLLFGGIFIPRIADFTTSMIAFAVIFTLIIVLIKNNIIKYIAIAVTLIIIAASFKDSLLVQKNNLLPIVIFSILFPTIIHVYVFTGIFLAGGALKQKLFSGYLSVGVFIACTVIFFLIVPRDLPTVSNELKHMFDKFRMMNKALMYVFGMNDYKTVKDIWIQKEETIYNSPYAFAVMRFIAFAYCYHYLNWFSKTSVIKWHDVSKTRMLLIIFLWIVSVGLYAWNYNVGFYALFILSMLHVFFEFPLNLISIKNLFTTTKR